MLFVFVTVVYLHVLLLWVGAPHKFGGLNGYQSICPFKQNKFCNFCSSFCIKQRLKWMFWLSFILKSLVLNDCFIALTMCLTLCRFFRIPLWSCMNNKWRHAAGAPSSQNQTWKLHSGTQLCQQVTNSSYLHAVLGRAGGTEPITFKIT